MKLQQAAEALFPRSRVKEFAPYWAGVESYADLSTPQRRAMFLAQIGHECGGFTRFEENLGYRPEVLLDPRMFSAGRISRQDAYLYGYIPGKQKANPEEIANRIYGGDWGRRYLGNTQKGDGWKYRGRGPKQVTGRANYAALNPTMGDRFGVDFLQNPELLTEPKYGIYAAADFWKSHNLGALTDARHYDRVTKTVNGALTAHDKRMALYVKALNLPAR